MQKLTFRMVVWYLKRPRLYPELFRIVSAIASQRGRPEPPDTRREAVTWCRARAVGVTEAIARITGSPMPESVRTKFRDALSAARQAASRCPVKMGGATDLDLLYWLIERRQAKKVVETGVGYGWSSLVILLSLAQRKNALLVSSDRPYPERENDAYVGCIVPTGLRPHWRIIRYADREAIPKALRLLRSVDVCHYDSDKSYAAKRWTYARLWEALRPGGYFIADDIEDDLAFHDFCREVGAEPIVAQTSVDFSTTLDGVSTFIRSIYDVGVKYTGVVVKRTDAQRSKPGKGDTAGEDLPDGHLPAQGIGIGGLRGSAERASQSQGSSS